MSQVIREVPQHEPYPEGAITLSVLEMQEGVHGVVPEADGQETQGGRVGDSFSELKWMLRIDWQLVVNSVKDVVQVPQHTVVE